jgi:hypothetical protein
MAASPAFSTQPKIRQFLTTGGQKRESEQGLAG